MLYFKVQRPCLRAASLKVAGRKCPFLFERYVTTHWRDLWHNRCSPLPRISQSRHLKSEPRKSWSISTLCMVCFVYAYPTALPVRCKQHCVCHLQFWERPFCDRPCSVPVSACQLFCFLLGDEESCPFSFNKQTAVGINKLKGSGCGPVRTVCSVRLSVCLACVWARGAPRPNSIGPKAAHNGLPHINRFRSLVQHQHYFSPATFVSEVDQVEDD